MGCSRPVGGSLKPLVSPVRTLESTNRVPPTNTVALATRVFSLGGSRFVLYAEGARTVQLMLTPHCKKRPSTSPLQNSITVASRSSGRARQQGKPGSNKRYYLFGHDTCSGIFEHFPELVAFIVFEGHLLSDYFNNAKLFI